MAVEHELVVRLAGASVAAIGDLNAAADACVVGTVRATRALFSPGRGVACVGYRFRDSMGMTSSAPRRS